mmetsp:Transcript_64405/g.185040  ORF Transcript_64405/g.185040 Transcript_64405/m.185040 type:complete len:220 (-) Transcript_64405:1060-1719(-)
MELGGLGDDRSVHGPHRFALGRVPCDDGVPISQPDHHRPPREVHALVVGVLSHGLQQQLIVIARHDCLAQGLQVLVHQQLLSTLGARSGAVYQEAHDIRRAFVLYLLRILRRLFRRHRWHGGRLLLLGGVVLGELLLAHRRLRCERRVLRSWQRRHHAHGFLHVHRIGVLCAPEHSRGHHLGHLCHRRSEHEGRSEQEEPHARVLDHLLQHDVGRFHGP